MTTNTMQFSFAKARLSQLFDRIVGSTRVYRIRHQRHKGEVAILPAEMLDGLLAQIAILRDPEAVKRIEESRKARREGKLVEYIPKKRR